MRKPRPQLATRSPEAVAALRAARDEKAEAVLDDLIDQRFSELTEDELADKKAELGENAKTLAELGDTVRKGMDEAHRQKAKTKHLKLTRPAWAKRR